MVSLGACGPNVPALIVIAIVVVFITWLMMEDEK